MTTLSVNPPFPVFTDVDGDPLDAGYIYIGTAGLNAITNPINVYWDAALTVPAAQPIRTIGGYPSYNGSPSRIYANSDYSIIVRNKNSTLIYSSLNATERYSDVVVSVDTPHVDTYADLRLFNDVMKVLFVRGRSSVNDGAEGIFERDDSDVTSADNDGTIIIDALSRRWKRSGVDRVFVEWFGAVGNADGTIGGGTDSTTAIQNCWNWCRDNAKTATGVPGSRYRTTSTLTTQYNASYKTVNIDMFGCEIVADFTGSACLNIIGQSFYNNVAIRLRAATGRDSSTGTDTVSHGAVISETRGLPFRIDANAFKGHGINVVCNGGGNSNVSHYILGAGGCNQGVRIEGTDDNLSVGNWDIRTIGNKAEGLFVTTDCMLRDSEFEIYAENNCVNDVALTGVDVGKARSCNWVIYSEQGSAAQEIVFRANTEGNFIYTARNNKDSDASTADTNLWYRGSRFVRGTPQFLDSVFVNTGSSSANAIGDDIVIGTGSANAGLTINHGANIGAIYLQNGSSNTYGGITQSSTGNLQFRAGGVGGTWQIAGATSAGPVADNAMSAGTGALRYSVIYAGTGAINTSDERAKQDISAIDPRVLAAWANVNFCQYKFRDAVEQKGDGARIHFGVIAQQVKAAFEAEGLDPFAYGVLCYDEWPERTEERYVDEETGEEVIITPHLPAGNRYGVRYEEAMVLEMAYLRSRIGGA